MLGELGFSEKALARIDLQSMDPERELALAWLSGMVSPRGRDRGKSIRDCGRLFPALLPDGQIVVMARPCKDRGCPRCMKRKAGETGRQLREACSARLALGKRLLFVTLTQAKRPLKQEGAGEAVDRLLAGWAKLTRSKSGRRNDALRSMFFGAMRSVECVWAGRGKKVWSRREKDQSKADWKRTRRLFHTVRFNGWHAHCHCVFELSDDVSREDFEREIRAVWRWASPESHPDVCVDVQEVKVEAVGECCKYVTKPFELPEWRAKELFRAVESRHMVYGVKGWKSWRSWATEEDNPYAGALLAAESLRTMALRFEKYEARGRGAIEAPSVAFMEYHRCKERERTIKRVAAVREREDVFKGLGRTAGSQNTAAAMESLDQDRHAAKQRTAAERAEVRTAQLDRKRRADEVLHRYRESRRGELRKNVKRGRVAVAVGK